MLKSILLALDGSKYSTAATELGIEWARRCDALLVGLGVIDEPTLCHPQAVPLGAGLFKQQRDQAVLEQARQRTEQVLSEFARRSAAAGVAHKLLEDVGLPSDQILLEAQRYDLILLGQQTYFDLGDQADSKETLSRVLHASPRPVVTVPETLPSGSTVMVAYDGSLQAARVLQAFETSGLASWQDVHVVSLHDDPVEAARCANRAVEFLDFHGIKAIAHPLRLHGAPAEMLLAEAGALNARLMVMGAYGRPTLRDCVLGSVTQAVLKQGQLPLFVYH